jgi:hypothetical protein
VTSLGVVFCGLYYNIAIIVVLLNNMKAYNAYKAKRNKLISLLKISDIELRECNVLECYELDPRELHKLLIDGVNGFNSTWEQLSCLTDTRFMLDKYWESNFQSVYFHFILWFQTFNCDIYRQLKQCRECVCN